MAAAGMELDGSSSISAMAQHDEGGSSEEEKFKIMESHIEDLLDRNKKANVDFDRLNGNFKRQEQELATCRQTQVEVEQRAELLTRQLKQKQDENVQLKEEHDTLRRQLCEAISAKLTATMQLDDLASREEAFTNRQKLANQEMEVLRGQKQNLEEQLAKLECELSAALSGSREAELNKKIDHFDKQMQQKDEINANLRETLSREQITSQRLRQQVLELQASEQALQQVHQQEVQAQARVAILYQEESREARAMAEQNSAAVVNLQTTLKDATDKLEALQASANKDKATLLNQLQQNEKIIEDLKQQVENSNLLLEQTKQETVERFVAQLFPTAAAMSQHLQSDLTLSKIYTRYGTAVSELESVRGERDLLTLRISFLSSQLEDRETEVSDMKASMMRTEEELQRFQTEKHTLQAQLCELQESCDEAKRSARQHANDKSRLQGQVNDLKAQVVHLVKEKVPQENPDTTTTEKMLLFDDVEGLQHRNVELLALVRELQERAERAENALTSAEDVATVSAKLEETRAHLRRKEASIESQEQMLQILIRQRDHFEKLARRPDTKDVALSPINLASPPAQAHVTQTSPVPPVQRIAAFPGPGVQQQFQQRPPQRPPFNPAGGPRFPTQANFQELRMKLRKSEETLATLNKDFETYKKDARNHFNIVTEQLETMRTQLSESKLEQARLHASNESDRSRLASARSNIESLTRQVDSLQAMRAAQDETNAKQEKLLLDVHKELVGMYAKVSQAEVALERSQAEIRRLRVAEGSLRHECDALKKSSSTQQMVLQSVQELRACRLTAEAEQRLQLSQQLEVTKQEVHQLKQQIKDDSSRLGEEILQLKGTVTRERTTAEQAKAEVVRAEAEVTRIMERLAQAERDIHALRAHRNAVVEAEAQTDLLGRDEQEAVERLRQLEEEVRRLSGELEQSRQLAQREGERANTTQQQLADLTAKSTADQAEALKKLQLAELLSTKLRSSHTTLEAELNVSREQLRRAEQQLEAAREEARARQNVVASNTPADSVEVGALRSALAAAKEQAQRAAEQHTRSVEQHKLDMQALTTFRKQAVTAENTIIKLKKELEDATTHVKEAETFRDELEKNVDEREQLIKDLQAQNSALMDQIQQMGTKEQSKDVSANTSLNLSSSMTEEDAHGQEQLLVVLRHLRREKDMVTTRAESLEAKAAGLTLQLENSQKQLADALAKAEKVVKADAAKPAMIELPHTQYIELLQKSETVNALADASIAQREKCTTLERQVATLTQEVKSVNTLKQELAKAQEGLKTTQVELNAVRGEAARWRTRANQLTERANRANPEELKRLQTERDTLQKQLREDAAKMKTDHDNLLKQQAVERDNLHKQLIGERDEIRKLKSAMLERDAELTKLRPEITRIQSELTTIQGQLKTAQEELVKKDKLFSDLANKELQVRRIAKKYKTQYEELTKIVEEKAAQQTQQEAGTSHTQQLEQSQQQQQQLETQLRETEAKLAAAVAEKDARPRDLDREERMKKVLNNARQQISNHNTTIREREQSINELNTKLRQSKDEHDAQLAALKSQYESRVARLEQEISRLEREASEHRSDTQQRPPIRQPQQLQGAKSGTSVVEKTSVEPPTANIRPMAGPSSQAKPQQGAQSAAVTPTSRAAPMARLRPMSMASPRSVAVLAPSQQQQQASSSMGGTMVQPEPSTSSAPPQGTSTSSQQGTQGAEVSAAATVVLVRPQEVQPAVSSSHNLQSTSVSAPSTSQQPPSATSHPPPTLKRPRDTDLPQQEPRLKQVRGEVTSAGESQSEATPEASSGSPEEQPSSSLHHVIVLDSHEAESVDVSGDGAEASSGNVVIMDETTSQQQQSQQQQEASQGNEANIEAEASSSSGTGRLAPQHDQPAEQSEPPSSSSQAARPPSLRPPSQSFLVLPQQQGYEEIGDDGIVPSTPTLFVPRRREGFGEGVSSPQVPQAQGRLFTFAPESSHPAPTQGSSDTLEPMEEGGTGRSVPSTPLLISPQDTEACASPSISGIVESEAGNEATSSVPSISVTDTQSTHTASEQQSTSQRDDRHDQVPQQVETGVAVPQHLIPTRGSPVLRRPQGRAVPSLMRSQPRNLIVWDAPQQQQQQPQPHHQQVRGIVNGGRVRGLNRGMGRSSPNTAQQGSPTITQGRGVQMRGSPRGPPPNRVIRRPMTRRPPF